MCTQIFSRTLVSGCDRASVFAWAVVNAIYNGNSDDPHDIPMISRSIDTNCCSLDFQGQIFEHHRNLGSSVQLLAEVLFTDMYPRDCTGINWNTVNIASSCRSGSAAAAACDAVFLIMDAAAWSHGVVLTARGVNFDATPWVRSTSYRCVQSRFSFCKLDAGCLKRHLRSIKRTLTLLATDAHAPFSLRLYFLFSHKCRASCPVVITMPFIPLFPFLTTPQVLCWCCGSHSAAVEFISSTMTSNVLGTYMQPLYTQMLSCRSLTSLLLHACDVTDTNHPLHVIASDSVELIAQHSLRQVVAAAASSPSTSDLSLPCSLFLASAVASRAGFCSPHNLHFSVPRSYFSGYFARDSTSSSALALCTAAVDMLHKSPLPLPHACAFGLQLIACCIGDSGNHSCCTISLSQAMFLINVCSSFIAQPPHAEDQTSDRNLNSSVPSPYPLVLHLPGQRIAPLPVAAAAGTVFVFLFMLDMLVVRMAAAAAFCERFL
jgi:hypothetical protein